VKAPEGAHAGRTGGLMAAELFSRGWAEAWRDEINGSDAFHDLGADWQGSLALVVAGDDGDQLRRGVFVDLRGGRCEKARPATARDLERAGFVVAARPETWRDLFAGRADLLFSIVLGRFRLERGSLAELKPHVAAARALLAAAGRVETSYPAARG
jgi:hypothetical protein